ncbi:MAG TPA: hypothetical protein VIK27_08950 [Candidatus Aquilonibacter sp.]
MDQRKAGTAPPVPPAFPERSLMSDPRAQAARYRAIGAVALGAVAAADAGLAAFALWRRR